MNALERLQEWYADQCDGDWEHRYGVKIESLDNPGWLVKVDLMDTELQDKPFAPIEHGLQEGDPEHDWMICSIIEGSTFRGAGDPSKLEAILESFLAWAGEPR